MFYRTATFAFCLSLLPAMAQYTVQQDGPVVHLNDERHNTTVSILPGFGNIAFEMKVNGVNVLYFPAPSIDEFEKRPALAGIPLLAPWANRLDEPAFYANGKKYVLNPGLGNVRAAPNSHPIHGFLTYAKDWHIVEAKAAKDGAFLQSKLDVYRSPEAMAQFPFAHTIEITYRLRDGVLEVATRIENLSNQPMPVAVGFHPYFRLTDSPRDEWKMGVGARSEWVLSPDKIPTGEKRPIEGYLANSQDAPLKNLDVDHVFGDLIRDSEGRALMSVLGKKQRIDVLFGPNYRAAVVYAPAGANREFICFEPMAGITNAMNLAQQGKYSELQSIPAGGNWQASFWVRPTGFTK